MLDYGLRAEMSKKGKLMLDSNGFNRIWDVLSIYNKDDRYAKD